jgi:hypothetical protein
MNRNNKVDTSEVVNKTIEEIISEMFSNCTSIDSDKVERERKRIDRENKINQLLGEIPE